MRPTDAALRSIGSGVAADIRVKRAQSLGGIVALCIVALIFVPLLIVFPLVGIGLFMLLAGAFVWALWEYRQYDDAHQSIERAAAKPVYTVLPDPRERSTADPPGQDALRPSADDRS